MDKIDHIFTAVAAQQTSYAPIMACLYTGATKPPGCAPMARMPEPETGMTLDGTFASHLTSALAFNAAVHDGVTMVGRNVAMTCYRVTGWSYRLFPPPSTVAEEPNRGSAFNSCLAMSLVDSVDRLYLVSRGSVICFERGLIRRL
jgi:hypothetical protein